MVPAFSNWTAMVGPAWHPAGRSTEKLGFGCRETAVRSASDTKSAVLRRKLSAPRSRGSNAHMSACACQDRGTLKRLVVLVSPTNPRKGPSKNVSCLFGPALFNIAPALCFEFGAGRSMWVVIHLHTVSENDFNSNSADFPSE